MVLRRYYVGGFENRASAGKCKCSMYQNKVTPIETKRNVPSHSRDAGDTSGKMEGIHRPRYPISNIQFGYGRRPMLRALGKGREFKSLKREFQLQMTNHWVASRSSHV